MASLLPANTCINTFYKTLLEVKNAALNSSNSSLLLQCTEGSI